MTAVEVHHIADGPEAGDVVVLSGSLGSDLRMWEPQMAPLTRAGYRVVRYDHRGHGASPVPEGPYALDDVAADAVALLDRIGADRVHWVGLSLGGMVGQWLGAHAPDRIASLTLLSTSAQLGPPEMWADRARLVQEKGTEAVAAAVVERWFTPGWRAAHPDRVRFYEDMVAATPAEGYASCCTAIATMDLVRHLPDVEAPTLVIAGAQDPAIPPEHGQRIAGGVQHGRLEVLEPAAHLANVEQAARVSALVLDHVRRQIP
jgi:3-oxoadipate enol-lactonase